MYAFGVFLPALWPTSYPPWRDLCPYSFGALPPPRVPLFLEWQKSSLLVGMMIYSLGRLAGRASPPLVFMSFFRGAFLFQFFVWPSPPSDYSFCPPSQLGPIWLSPSSFFSGFLLPQFSSFAPVPGGALMCKCCLRLGLFLLSRSFAFFSRIRFGRALILTHPCFFRFGVTPPLPSSQSQPSPLHRVFFHEPPPPQIRLVLSYLTPLL